MSTPITLRPARYSDVEAVADLHVEGWRSSYATALDADFLRAGVVADRHVAWRDRLGDPRPGQRVVVACDGDDVVGFGCVYLDADPVWGAMLDNLHVTAAQRGRGVGAELLGALALLVEQQTPRHGLHLWVLHANQRAERFYRRHGAVRGETVTWHAPEGSSVPAWRYAWRGEALPLGSAACQSTP